MAGVITTGNHPKALWPGVAKWWGRSYSEHTMEWPEIFDIENSTKKYEEDVQVTGFGLAPVKAEGAAVSYDSETQGFTTRYTNVSYGLGYIVTYEELQDNLYAEVSQRRAQALGFSFRQTEEVVHANILNRGFNSSYTGGDGVELFSTAHPTLSGNQSNHLTTAADLSEASLEDLLIQIAGAQNDRGLNISIMPKCLIVPRQLWFDANRIVKSSLQSDTANNSLNVIRATGALKDGIKLNHYLTDQDAWFVKTDCPRGLMHFWREKTTFDKDNDFDTKNAKAKGYARYVTGHTDFRGAYASPGA